MGEVQLSTREKIIIGTIEFIEKNGVHAVTTRGIAKEAGVNSASINYYFGSKENLLNETFKHTIRHFLGDSAEFIEKNCKDPYLLLRDLLLYYLEGALRYPQLSKAFLFEPFFYKDYNDIFVKEFTDFLRKLSKKIKELIPQKNENEIKMAVSQLVSAVLMPGLMAEVFKNFMEVDLTEPENQKKYVAYLLEQYFKNK